MKLHKAHPMIRFWHYVSEFLATFIFFFIASMMIGIFFGLPAFKDSFLTPEMRVLIVVAVLICTTLAIVYSPLGKISGAHMNPAVSFAFWMEDHLKTMDLIFYVLVQIIATFAAIYLVSIIIPDPAIATKLGLPEPASEHRIFVEFGSEIFATGVLISFLFFFLSEKLLVKYTGALMGCYIFFIKLISIEAVSLNLNPAKYLGAAAVFHHFSNAWLYIAGPFIGTFLAVMLHRSWSILKRPKYFRLNHEEGYLEKLFSRYSDLKKK
jgi:aquaporin Z